MSIRWDAPLVHHLAADLDDRLSGARLRALRLDGEARDAALLLRESTLLWRLHPTRGYPRLTGPVEPAASDVTLRGRVRGVRAPADDRVLVLELLPARGRPVDLVVELMDNQWNLVVVERPEGTVRHVLRRRQRGRELRVGARYDAPPPSDREGAAQPLPASRWRELNEEIARLDPEERKRYLLRRVAWTSRLNLPDVIAALERGETPGIHPEERPPEPVVLDTERGPQPYPYALSETPCRRAAGLLEAFEAVASEVATAAPDDAPALLPPDLDRGLERALDRARRRAVSLEAELDGLEDPVELRALGDLLLARYEEVRRGEEEVELTDFEGRSVRIPLDPAKPVHENADDLYERAARSERARNRLPALIRTARTEAAELEELVARVRAGEVRPEEVRDLLDLARPAEGGGREPPTRPYRRFRSSGGLEIRVGKGARHNDDLTFRHSAPDDVWLHARHAAGAHVVLRWRGPGNPPARDLHEAAVLAAVHSRAAGSGTVPVDWTFRKYVRKPRGAGPGSVLMEREKTLFVRPDEGLVARLGSEEA